MYLIQATYLILYFRFNRVILVINHKSSIDFHFDDMNGIRAVTIKFRPKNVWLLLRSKYFLGEGILDLQIFYFHSVDV